MTAGPVLEVHAVVERSRANGPGERMVIWVQGCTLGCPRCFNPATHAPGAGETMAVAALANRVAAAAPHLDGLTVSGGEPFAQAHALAALLDAVKARTGLSILVFSGHTLREITADAVRARALAHIDVLVAGRYARTRHAGRALLGSSNQRIHRLTARYRLEELEATPECEVHLGADGSVLVTGVAPVDAARALADGL